MSRRAPRSRNTARNPQILAACVAVAALVIGVLLPAEAASATTSTGLAASAAPARTASTAVASGLVKSTLVGFSAGNIISDAVFTRKNSMTEAQIQSFFNSKVSKCLGGKDEDGKAIVCLKDFKITSVTRSADSYCKGYTGAANESAARIIYKVAQSCNINPQVLIVMLQKEQGLITHTWPSAWRFNIALGQGCPDTAPCDPNYIGFFHQIYGAARQMQIYLEGKYFQWYAPGKTWNILYNPNSSCGSAPVYVKNAATAALYYYTPYQPNAAALAAGYGTGNSCSAYGNRNFYNYFTDWFGSTQAAEEPAVTPPVLKSVNGTGYTVTLDASGGVWAYPYSQKTWGARVQLASGLTGITSIVGVGDVDGDGNRDFIALDKKSKATLLRSDGGTTLRASQTLSGTWTGVKSVVPAGDFDGDGIADVFTTNSKGELFLRAGTGTGGYRAPVRVGTGWNTMDQLIGGIDWNGDKKTDVVARDATGALYLYPGNGRGGWGTRVLLGRGWTAMTSIFSSGDFDGDGKPDVLAHGADGALSLYRGSSSGSLSAAGVVGTGWGSLISKSGVGPTVSGKRVLPGGLGDVDGAIGNDVFALSSAGVGYVYGGNGTGAWGARSTISSGWNASDKVFALGDFTGDGYRDLGRIDKAGVLTLYAGKSGGGFAAPVQIGKGWQGFTRVIGGLDYDGDGLTDVITVTSDGRMLLYRGDGRGGWGAGAGTQIGKGWGNATQIFYAGDFDGDGRGDLIARMADGTLRSYPLTGKGSFGTSAQIGRGWSAFTTVFSPGDFNGDGRSDIIGVDAKGGMHLYAGTGSGTMKTPVKIGSGWTSMRVIG